MRPRSRKEIDQSKLANADRKERKEIFAVDSLEDIGIIGRDHSKGSVGLPWRYSAPSWMIASISCAIGVGVFAATLTFELILRWHGSTSIVIAVASDILAGLLAGLLHYSTVRSLRRRRAMILQRLQLIADMNHHIRNALEIIQLSAALAQKPELSAIINESTERITWALKEILGVSPSDT